MSEADVALRCDEVVQRLDALLAEKSDRADEALSEATTCVVRLRDDAIAQRRARADDQGAERRLRRINSVLSLVVGSHYTLVGLRWQRIEKARDEVKALLSELRQPRDVA